MPSYRVRLELGLLRGASDPASVLGAARAAVAERAAVEAADVDLRAGIPSVVVRFEAADDLAASQVGRHAAGVVDELVVVEASRVLRRTGSRWSRLGSSGPRSLSG